jgi:dTDP-4-dehydrorhamnose reductase
MLRLGAEKDEINVVYDQIGTPTYAGDLAKAILDIVKQFEPKAEKRQEIYHFTNEGVASWYDFACEIFRINKVKCKVNPVDSNMFRTPAKRPAFSVLNKSKIKKDYSIHINHWADSLAVMLDVLKKNN